MCTFQMFILFAMYRGSMANIQIHLYILLVNIIYTSIPSTHVMKVNDRESRGVAEAFSSSHCFSRQAELADRKGLLYIEVFG